eukprot:TRINITY_DN3833_c0_g1_i2.p1 TRINITY_DN3833_c0_g1~~TRINITY_DN3833_c0_g1_i2.p1  ORF type:complete len:543 (-),score=94.64 TRINITY_DN3833_c0_g1_i2:235-1863(-)
MGDNLDKKRKKEDTTIMQVGGSSSMPDYGPPEIDPSEITREHVLGDGSFGSVYKGRCRQKDVAVKVLFRQLEEKTLRDFRKEVAIMSKIFHPNIVLFLGACTSVPGKLQICTELMKGNVETILLDPNAKLSLLQRLKMTRDAALGVLWLHSSNPVCIHRDLKTSNLLVDSNLTVKVCDFGLSQIVRKGQTLHDGREGAKGTPLWMAPEVLLGKTFNEKADVYSFGLVLWQMITRRELFPEYTELEPFIEAICYRHVRPPLPADTLPAIRDLIQACWAHHADQRPGFSQIVAALENIIVDCAISDPYGALLWKKHFKYKEEVEWPAFINMFGYELGLAGDPNPASVPSSTTHQSTPPVPPMIELLTNYPHAWNDTARPFTDLNCRCLKAVVATKPLIESDVEVVSMDQFGKVLAWFGDLRSDGADILDKMRDLMTCPWFHGDISTQESEDRLANKPEGTFLARFSTTEEGAYTVSKVSSQGGISHQRVHRPAPRQYMINTHMYTSIPDLIRRESANLNLLTPCLGSRFLFLFKKLPVGSGYVS